jgi:predicted RNA-binding Zn-ribbon protein involved in translation (DUF1610 family)
MSSRAATVSTGPNRETGMTRARALATHSGRSVLGHPDHKGAVVLGVLAPRESPWSRLASLLSAVPFRDWPQDGWILIMELTCEHCGETRLVELHQSSRGAEVFCNVCGKATVWRGSVTPKSSTT